MNIINAIVVSINITSKNTNESPNLFGKLANSVYSNDYTTG